MDAEKESSPTRSAKKIQGLRNKPERQLGSLRGVIDTIRREGGTPSAESSNATERHAYCRTCIGAAGTAANSWQPVCAAGGCWYSGEAYDWAAGRYLLTSGKRIEWWVQ